MKKIFTLLFCVVALSAAADTDAQIQQCINALLDNSAPTKVMAANNLDADGDGVLSIADVTTLIDQKLQGDVNRAPAKQIDIDALADEIVRTNSSEPNVKDLNEAIDQNLKNK
jgi:hypothetical protein